MTTIRTAFLSVAVGSALAASLAAQGNRTMTMLWRPRTQPSAAVDATAHRQDAAADSVNGTFGIDFATGYFFRAIRQEDQGWIGQPHLELDYTLTDGTSTSGLQSLDLVFGTWNSLHEGPSGTGGGQQAWYESDFYIGLAAGIADRWSAGMTYSWYSSPNGSFGTAEELTFSLGFDDSGEWGEAFPGLQPSAVLGFEIVGQADGGSGRGVYAQCGIEPSFALGQTGDFDWQLAVPVAIGLSLDSYYEHPVTGKDRPLGFLDVGAAVSTPLPMIPSRFGPWTMTVSLHALLLGDATEALNSGDGVEFIGALGFSTAL